MSTVEPRKNRTFGRLRDKPALLVGLVLFTGLLLRLLWMAYTQHASDDAYITFRFAANLARGNGFTYNPGERVYGTTSPLFTLLLAIWRLATAQDIVDGAHALGLLASMGSLLLLAAVLRIEHVRFEARLLTLVVLAVTSKVLLLDMQGMEMPLVICLMMGSWLAYAQGRRKLAGFLAGCLLWARIDLALWPLALVLVEVRTSRRGAAEIGGFAGLTYLPWVIFAALYFGSPVPHTVIAKATAYGIGRGSVLGPLATVLGYLSPLDWQLQSRPLDLAAGCLMVGLAAWQVTRSGRSKAFGVLALFGALELIALVASRATFFTRYLYPLLWTTLVLGTIGAASLWMEGSARLHRRRWVAVAVCLAVGATLLVQTAQAAGRIRAAQRYRNEASLEAIGRWLAARGPAGATVLLEPLGYIGFTSGMRMIDEVGLISPEVVALKRQEVPVEEYFAVFWPDYIVEHCDDAARFERARDEDGVRFADVYERVRVVSPTIPETIRVEGLERSVCYVLWQRVQAGSP